MTILPILKSSLEKCKIVNRNGYNYFIHPISDGVPCIHPVMINEIVRYIPNITDVDGVDYVLTIEAMGIPIATELAIRKHIPLNIVRKRPYHLEGEIELAQSTGYSKGNLYVNGLHKGDKVLIVDDVISTGGTLVPLVKALHTIGVEITDVIIAIGRGEGYLKLKELGITPKNQNIIISIKDFGCGISEEIGNALFKHMITTKGKDGTGLGLYISYSTIKAQFGGEMWYESILGKGSTFCISIPIYSCL
jgi:adenine phosphoribosyltransferase